MAREWAERAEESAQVKSVLRGLAPQLIDVIADRRGGIRALSEVNKFLFVASKHERGQIPWHRRDAIHAECVAEIEAQFKVIVDEYKKNRPTE
jgi:hypothetical protein